MKAATLQELINEAVFKTIEGGPLTIRLLNPLSKREIKNKRYQRVACISHERIKGGGAVFTSAAFPFSYNRPVHISVFAGETAICGGYAKSGVTTGTTVKIQLDLR